MDKNHGIAFPFLIPFTLALQGITVLFFFLLFVVVEINPPARLLWTCYRCSRSFLGGGGWKREEREREYANAILRQPLPVPLVKTGFILNDDAHLFFLFCKRKERKNKNKINKLIT